ncbi:MAG: hypothetical protein HY509_02020, partial [Acidobacteria bacterium]|nr:hypothetical protein [Acidobacteriota bacterium]
MKPELPRTLLFPARKTRIPVRGVAVGGTLLLLLAWVAFAATSVPTDIRMPGTQPVGVDDPPSITSYGNCGCHDFTDAINPHPDNVPVFGWLGGMMANAGRDPLFWATLAVAEQDFLPGSGGVGDLCLKCHSPKGWIEGRSTPTNGSGLDPSTDDEGVMCDFCHLLVNPDADNTIPPVHDPRAGYYEEQNAPFLAYDEATGAGYYGGAEYVLNREDTRLGPFPADAAKHAWIQSPFHRDARLCGTCHDVSNPAVGDLAHNHGAQAPFGGVFNGTPNGTLTEKAALNNPPHTFGIVERTFTEWTASDLDTMAVNDFPSLPADLRVSGGALEKAYEAARRGFCSATATHACNLDQNCPAGETCVTATADFEDGSTRYFTCQTCHMAASGGKAAQQGEYRTDLPRHDQTGGSYWIQDAIQYQDMNGTLRFGAGLTSAQIAALAAGRTRAEAQLRSAAALQATQDGWDLRLRVTNLTGHKLITGYPEGRRMWLNLEWYDTSGNLLYANGAYGPIGNVVTDRDGTPFDVPSILEPASTRIYEAKPAMTREWAQQLLSLGYPGTMPLDYDRQTNSPVWTLQDLADEPAGSLHPTFHFILNNAVYKDTRIPPYGMQYD